MSDANFPLPREPDSPDTKGSHFSEWEVPSPWISEPKSESKSEPTQDHQDWQTVNFPNTLNINDIPLAVSDSQTSAAAPTGTTNPSAREVELLKLVGDLNQCNDNLLRRIAQLEETLENSQAALQGEIERSQEQGVPPTQTPQSTPNPNAQVAQLVSELDSTQQAFQRQRILTETLQAQLETSQQRVAQLERECALIQQRYTKQSQAVIEAEATCRDLRSRLQRQQHYTLQFKAALEKSLEMSSHSSQAPLNLSTDSYSRIQTAIKDVSPQPISMPKAQRIQPWSSDATLPGCAPNLDVLIRGLSPSSPNISSDSTKTTQSGRQSIYSPTDQSVSTSVSTKLAEPDLEAEALLWRDMERVIDGSRKLTKGVENPGDTEEQLGLQPPKAKQSGISSDFKSAPPLERNTTSVSAASQEQEPIFTEPSPWGEPLQGANPQQQQTSTTEESAAILTTNQPTALDNQSIDALPVHPLSPPKPSASGPIIATQIADSPPTLNLESVANSPSPIVYPLRPQKKIKSLAAVELPNFPRNQPPKR